MLLTLGLFQKAVFADIRLPLVVADAFNSAILVEVLDAYAGVVAFHGHVSTDVLAYSIWAIGVALYRGYSLPDKLPCLYIPLGGNCGSLEHVPGLDDH